MLEVPDSLNRNAKYVREMGTPAETGFALLNYMCERIGIKSLAGLNVLDLGCGVRFTQSIVNRNVPIGTYVGLETEKRIVNFLNENVADPRLTYHHVNSLNLWYNPKGEKLVPAGPSPLGDRKFDVACMFSVITHQQPDEVIPILSFLRNHVMLDGHLFFSCHIHDDHLNYKELKPESPGLRSSYSMSFMTKLLKDSDWSVVSVEGRRHNGNPIATSFLCIPATP